MPEVASLHGEFVAFEKIIGFFEVIEELSPRELPRLLDQTAMYDRDHRPVTVEEVLARLQTNSSPLPDYIKTRSRTRYLAHGRFDDYAGLASSMLSSMRGVRLRSLLDELELAPDVPQYASEGAALS